MVKRALRKISVGRPNLVIPGCAFGRQLPT
jgi:hypothetical protein